MRREAIVSPVKLCQVCGCRGPLVCGKCKKISYCGSLHQKDDWKFHKLYCGTSHELQPLFVDILFPEFEIIIEQEEEKLVIQQESEKEAEKRRVREYEDMVKSGNSGAVAEISEAEINSFAESKEDKTFGRFKAAIEGYETQVLRYARGGSPLWISDKGRICPSKVPNCKNCNGPRTFEFQVMPQMLNELKNFELDWGVIAVYTCEKDCDVNGKYVSEYCYKQDIMKDDDDEASELNVDSLKLSTDTNDSKVPKPSEDVKKTSQKMKKREVVAEPNQQYKKKTFVENDEW